MGAAALASGNEACPSVDGLFDPGSGPLCGSDRDHGTDLRLLIERVAGVHLLDAFGEPLRQGLPARLMHKDPLHGDAALPPSSSVQRRRGAIAFNFQPTSALPVKVNMRRRESPSMPAVTSFEHGRTLMAPRGQPASTAISPRRSAVSGVCGAGLMMMGLPEAMAGASLCATRLSGKLKGVIARMGPMGKRRMRPAR